MSQEEWCILSIHSFKFFSTGRQIMLDRFKTFCHVIISPSRSFYSHLWPLSVNRQHDKMQSHLGDGSLGMLWGIRLIDYDEHVKTHLICGWKHSWGRRSQLCKQRTLNSCMYSFSYFLAVDAMWSPAPSCCLHFSTRMDCTMNCEVK